MQVLPKNNKTVWELKSIPQQLSTILLVCDSYKVISIKTVEECDEIKWNTC